MRRADREDSFCNYRFWEKENERARLCAAGEIAMEETMFIDPQRFMAAVPAWLRAVSVGRTRLFMICVDYLDR